MTSPIDLSLVRDWLREAGQIALDHFMHVQVQFKPDNTPLTQVDQDIQAFLVDHIQENYPGHAILAEEGASINGAEFLWILDPLDGTRAFSVGLPIWGIAVGIVRGHQTIAGAYYMPYLNEMHWSVEGDGPYFNGRSVYGSIAAEWSEQLMFLAVPSNAHRHYTIEYPRTRALGSTLAHMVYVVRGAAIGALIRPVRVWDLAAGLAMLHAAGGAICYLSGAPFDLSLLLDGSPAPEPIIVAHPNLIERLLKSISVRGS